MTSPARANGSTTRMRVRERRKTRARVRWVMKLLVALVLVVFARAIFARWLTAETARDERGDGGDREAFAAEPSADPTLWVQGALEGGMACVGSVGRRSGSEEGRARTSVRIRIWTS